MAIIVMDCPHCQSQRMSFDTAGQYSISTDFGNRVFCFVKCRMCHMPAAIEMHSLRPIGEFHHQTAVPEHITVKEIWPKYEAPQAPAHLPEAVQRAYIAGAKTFSMENLEDASAGAFGRALELATKSLASDFPKLSLAARIDRLAQEHRLTPALAEWAHQIRLIRNDAVHEVESVAREELVAIRGFTEMVLTYLFTLPGMMAARQAEVPTSLPN